MSLRSSRGRRVVMVWGLFSATVGLSLPAAQCLGGDTPPVAIEGVVIDAAGRPVAGAEVRADVPGAAGELLGRPPVRAGGDGTFQLEGLDPEDSVSVRARTGDAVSSEPVVVTRVRESGRLTVKVAPGNVFRLRGRVVNGSGRPAAGVPVTVWWRRAFPSAKQGRYVSGWGVLDEVKTGPDGRFESPPLWPAVTYGASAGDDGLSRAETPDVSGVAGQAHELGTISLAAGSSHVAGRVVDTAGRPVADAEVFNRGDSPRPTTARTGSDGRFRLDGLYAASRFALARRDAAHPARLDEALRTGNRKYVFIRKGGYRFAGQAAEGERDDVAVTLRRQDEPVVQWRPADAATRDEEMRLATDLLLKLRERRWSKSPWRRQYIIALMARVDLDRAEAWAEEIGGLDKTAGYVQKLLDGVDAATGLAFLKRVEARNHAQDLATRLRLAWHLSSYDPEAARRIVRDSVAAARRESSPVRRTRNLAQASFILGRVGAADEARALADEAAREAIAPGAAAGLGLAQISAAKALAPYDPNRAMAVLETIKDPAARRRAMLPVIAQIAAADPTRALGMVDPSDLRADERQHLRSEIAYRVARTDPDRAIRIVDGMSAGGGAEKYQADALGGLAEAIAPRDRAGAYALIDRALALPIDHPGVFDDFAPMSDGLASSAGIALLARRIGYPDMDGVAMRVMAARSRGRSDSGPSAPIQSVASAAALAAIFDPGLARTILGQLEARAGLSAADLALAAGDRWLVAWALADLGHARSLAEASLSMPSPPERGGFSDGAVLDMIELLLIPPDRREAVLRGQLVGTWYPGKYD